MEIVPSILSVDFCRLVEQVRAGFKAGCKRIHIDPPRPRSLADLRRRGFKAGCKRIHIDVMEGHFVPNIRIGTIVPHRLLPLAEARWARLF